MRLVDWIAFRDEGEFNEADHPRDEDGKFSESEAAEGSSDNKQRLTLPFMTKEKREGLTRLKENLERGASPREVIVAAAKLMKGTVSCELPECGVVDVIVGTAFVKESQKYLYFPRETRPYPKALQVANVKRQLYVYEHLEEILKSGETTGWSNNPKHHAESDFLTMRKKVGLPGASEKWMTVDIKVRRGTRDKIVAHNASMTGNPGFMTKMKNWGKIGDEMVETVFELCDVTIN